MFGGLLLSLITIYSILFSSWEKSEKLKKKQVLLPPPVDTTPPSCFFLPSGALFQNLRNLLVSSQETKEGGDADADQLKIVSTQQLDMFTMSGQRLGLTTYYRTISVDNKPTTVIIGPSKNSFYSY